MKLLQKYESRYLSKFDGFTLMPPYKDKRGVGYFCDFNKQTIGYAVNHEFEDFESIHSPDEVIEKEHFNEVVWNF